MPRSPTSDEQTYRIVISGLGVRIPDFYLCFHAFVGVEVFPSSSGRPIGAGSPFSITCQSRKHQQFQRNSLHLSWLWIPSNSQQKQIVLNQTSKPPGSLAYLLKYIICCLHVITLLCVHNYHYNF